MRYDITTNKAPEMPNLGKGTECIKLLLSQTSKDMHEPLVPMLFPSLAAHISGAEFQYPDRSWREMCGLMANLVGDSGCNKGQLTDLTKAICRDFHQHDEAEMNKLREWAKISNSKSKSKDGPVKPDAPIFLPPANTTSAAFLENAIALEAAGGRTQLFNFPEVEMADQLCGSHKYMSHLLRNIYDMAQAGALRATASGVSGNPTLRATFGRMVFSYRPRDAHRSGHIPRKGEFNDSFYQELDTYLARLDMTKGRFIIRPLNKLIDQLAADMASLADLVDDDVLWDVSKRALVSAWKAGCVLWVLNAQTWTRAMGDLVEWLVYHDLWSKTQVFADLLGKDGDVISEARRRGPRNMLDKLPEAFNEAQLQAIRTEVGKAPEGAKEQLRNWVNRGFITYSNQTGLYSKTEAYLKGNS